MPYDKASTRIDATPPSRPVGMSYSKTCAECGDEFVCYSHMGKYCSLRCVNDAYMERRRKRAATQRAGALVCAVCAAELPQGNAQGNGRPMLYCGGACRQKAYRARRRKPLSFLSKQVT